MECKCLAILLALSATGFSGSLITYKAQSDLSQDASTRISRIGAFPATVGTNAIQIDISQIMSQAQLTINLPDNSVTTAIRDKSSTESDGSTVWVGHMSSGVGRVTFVVKNGSVAGSIQIGARLFKVLPIASGMQAFQEINSSMMPSEDPPPRPGATITNDIASNDAPPGTSTPVLDILVTYTTNVESAVSDVGVLAQLAIQESNTGLTNSTAGVRFRLAGVAKMVYDETGKSWNTIRDNFFNRTDGVMDNVVLKRNSVRADITVLLVQQADWCGEAYGIGTNTEDAYVVVNQSCATGYYSFAHEIGHILGARHDVNADPTNTPFAYGHGYQYFNSNGVGQWRTIMAYSGTCGCPRIDYWSNPDVTYGGVATGTTAAANNARVLTQQAQKYSWGRSRNDGRKAVLSD